jgi:quinol monooxygenase YgiN
MYVAIVQVSVSPEHIQAFEHATLENARQSLREPGVARFDVLHDAEHPTEFVLYEVYRDAQAPARHKETAHYLHWRDTVATMLAAPRTSKKYTSLFPSDRGWDAVERE